MSLVESGSLITMSLLFAEATSGTNNMSLSCDLDCPPDIIAIGLPPIPPFLSTVNITCNDICTWANSNDSISMKTALEVVSWLPVIIVSCICTTSLALLITVILIKCKKSRILPVTSASAIISYMKDDVVEGGYLVKGDRFPEVVKLKSDSPKKLAELEEQNNSRNCIQLSPKPQNLHPANNILLTTDNFYGSKYSDRTRPKKKTYSKKQKLNKNINECEQMFMDKELQLQNLPSENSLHKPQSATRT